MLYAQYTALINRAQKILLSPKTEWEAIDGETTTIKDLYINYAVILAAVPAVCGFLRAVLFGYGAFGVTIRPSFFSAFSNMVVSYTVSLVGIGMMALVIEFLAPHFGGQKNRIQAFKISIYSSTAAWLSGIFMLLPGFSLLTIVGLYSIYLLYCGLPKLMKAPEEKALPFTAVTVVITAILFILAASLTSPFRGTPSGTADSHISGELALPNGQTINVAEMEKNLQAAQTASAAPVEPIAADALKGLLPENLPGGFARSEIDINSGGPAGQKISTAKASYTRDQSHIDVSLVDMAGTPQMNEMMNVFGSVEGSQETATSYSKHGVVDGRMTMEEYNNTANSGHYSVIIAKRVMLDLNGQNVSMDDLKTTVASIGLDKVEALAK